MDADNRDAFAVYQQVASRFVVDLQAGGTVLAWALADREPADALTCVARLAVIYDVTSPPPTKD